MGGAREEIERRARGLRDLPPFTGWPLGPHTLVAKEGRIDDADGIRGPLHPDSAAIFIAREAEARSEAQRDQDPARDLAHADHADLGLEEETTMARPAALRPGALSGIPTFYLKKTKKKPHSPLPLRNGWPQ